MENNGLFIYLLIYLWFYDEITLKVALRKKKKFPKKVLLNKSQLHMQIDWLHLAAQLSIKLHWKWLFNLQLQVCPQADPRVLSF